MQGICKKYYGLSLSAEDLKNNEILHSFMAAYWLRKKIKYKRWRNFECNKVSYHRCRKYVSYLKNCLYSWCYRTKQNLSGVDKLRELAPKDLDLCILTEIEAKEKYLKSINKTPHKNTAHEEKSIKGEEKMKKRIWFKKITRTVKN